MDVTVNQAGHHQSAIGVYPCGVGRQRRAGLLDICDVAVAHHDGARARVRPRAVPDSAPDDRQIGHLRLQQDIGSSTPKARSLAESLSNVLARRAEPVGRPLSMISGYRQRQAVATATSTGRGVRLIWSDRPAAINPKTAATMNATV